MGVGVPFSSGNSGVGGGSCHSNDGTSHVKSIPSFPASCPFVTTVGGTAKVNPEVAASLSGEGFRTISLARPTRTDPPRYFRTLRALVAITLASSILLGVGSRYPDISAQALNYQVVLAGEVMGVDCTVRCNSDHSKRQSPS